MVRPFRHPRIRTCTVHIYNNYFDGNAKYGVGVTMGASAFVENNYFRSTASMKPMLSSGQGTDALGEGTLSGEAGGMIKSFGNIYDCSASNLKLLTQNNSSADQIDCYEASSRDEEVPESYKTAVGDTAYNNFDTAEDMYEYTVDTAERAKEKVERYAGRVDQGDIRYEFDDATQDANYDAIPELRNILNNYSKTLTLVKVGDLPVGGGSSGEGGSGGALAMAVADEVWMLENSIYSILSPEGFASILWKDSKRAEEAAGVMKLTSKDLKELGIIEKIIPEPSHLTVYNLKEVVRKIECSIDDFLDHYEKMDVETLKNHRYERFRNM